MSAPASINTLRSTDFPNGLTTKADLDRLFQILNPFLQQTQAVTTKGTALAQNIDGQFATFSFTAGPTFAPLNVRMKDGKRPQFILAQAQNTNTKSIESTWNPAWTYNGQSSTVGNTLTVTDLVGLTPGVPYKVSLFIFF